MRHANYVVARKTTKGRVRFTLYILGGNEWVRFPRHWVSGSTLLGLTWDSWCGKGTAPGCAWCLRGPCFCVDRFFLRGPAPGVQFSSSMADVALWLGPYMSISSKNVICTRTEKARKCRQITTNQPSHRPARRPANPPARLAFRQKKQQTRHTKRGKSPNKNTHKKICHRTQWSDHCITLKNMHTMN